METIKINSRLFTEERETIMVYDNIDKAWLIDTTISKHLNKAKKKGWKQTSEYIYEDGSVCGGTFVVPDRAISFRSAEKKQMSEKQMKNLFRDDEEDDSDED